MADIIIDGDFSVATEISVIRPVSPIKVRNESYLFEVDMMQDASQFTPLALNTQHDEIDNSYLVQETTPQSIGHGLIVWTRIYAKIPAQWNDAKTISPLFPGYVSGNSGAGNNDAREPFSDVVPARIQKDYFLIDGTVYQSIDDIPIISRQEFYGQGGEAFPVRILGGVSSPTKDEYIAMIAAGESIVAEDSSLAHWFGNIWERSTVYVRAR